MVILTTMVRGPFTCRAMLSGVIMVVLLMCYCCHKSIRKNRPQEYPQYWRTEPDAHSLEVFTTEAHAAVSISLSIHFQPEILETKLLLSPCIISSMHFSFLRKSTLPRFITVLNFIDAFFLPSVRFELSKKSNYYSLIQAWKRNILHRIKSNFILYRFEYKFSDNSPFQKHFFAANSDASFALKISRLTYSVEERPLAHTSFFTSIIETSSLRAHRVQK